VQIVGFAASVALAHTLGAVAATDTFFVAQSIPLFVSWVLLAAIRLGGIPMLTRRLNGEPRRLAEATSEILWAAAVSAALLSLVVTALAVAVMPVMISGAESVRLGRLIALELAPLPILMAVTAALSALLAVLGRFSVAVLVLLLDPLMRTVSTLLFAKSVGVEALAAGSVLGSALAVVVLWGVVRNQGLLLHVPAPLHSPAVREVLTFSVPLLISYAVLSLNPLVDRVMAAPLGSGRVTELQFALQLFNVPSTLLAAALITPLLAVWQKRFDSLGWASLRQSFVRAVEVVVVVIPPVVAIALVLRKELVIAIFQGGQFTEEDVDSVASAFGALLVGIPAQLFVVLYATLFLVRNRPWVPAAIGLANVVLNAALNLILRVPFGITGIAWSTTLTISVLTIAYALKTRGSYGPLLTPNVIRRGIRCCFAALCAGVGSFGLLELLPDPTAKPEAILEITVASVLGIALYSGILFGVGGRPYFRDLMQWRSRSIGGAESDASVG
jgi:peptidoglycan biosynthesis protein MviN/MurJ (putative lipid II flippase)